MASLKISTANHARNAYESHDPSVPPKNVTHARARPAPSSASSPAGSTGTLVARKGYGLPSCGSGVRGTMPESVVSEERGGIEARDYSR